MNKQQTFNALRQPVFVEQDCWTCAHTDNPIDGCSECGLLLSHDIDNPLNRWKWNGTSQPGDES